MKGAGCVACCCIITQDRIFLCHEDVQTNAVRTLGSLSIALLNAVFTDTDNDSCCVLVSQDFNFVFVRVINNYYILTAYYYRKFLWSTLCLLI